MIIILKKNADPGQVENLNAAQQLRHALDFVHDERRRQPAICRLIMRNPPLSRYEVQLRIFSDARSIANSAMIAQVRRPYHMIFSVRFYDKLTLSSRTPRSEFIVHHPRLFLT